MKILHAVDWHIGQLFHEYDRKYEHQQLLNWVSPNFIDRLTKYIGQKEQAIISIPHAKSITKQLIINNGL